MAGRQAGITVHIAFNYPNYLMTGEPVVLSFGSPKDEFYLHRLRMFREALDKAIIDVDAELAAATKN
jgi:hypothetical protein